MEMICLTHAESQIDEMFYMSPHQSYYDEETFIQFLIRARLV